MKITALFVQKNGHYFNLPDVDPWDERRDALTYNGSEPVVAHPPCTRWCRLAKFVQHTYGHKVGDDGGTFAHALATVRRCGGILEHPAFSLAWQAHGLNKPSSSGGWAKADDRDGWTCHVEQCHYGHAARKATWLYAVRCTLPDLKWGPGIATNVIGSCSRLSDGTFRRPVERMSKSQRNATPIPFRDVLIAMARSVRI